MTIRHFVSAQEWSRNELTYLFQQADEMKTFKSLRRLEPIMHGMILATFFYEPSTRTRFSFEAATLRLGGQVISTENAKTASSVFKEESLEDSIRVIGGFADIICLRSDTSGGADRAAAVSYVPVINGGDGASQHPTQALLDLYTISDEIGSIDGITIAMVGDLLNGRTVRSLCYLLAKCFRVTKIYLVAPRLLRMSPDILEYLSKKGIPYEETSDLDAVLSECDVVYMTRIQKERFGKKKMKEYQSLRGSFIIDKDAVSKMKRKSIIMHPLPRVNEILPEVDMDPRAAYFRQSHNGLFVRMALLKYLTEESLR